MSAGRAGLGVGGPARSVFDPPLLVAPLLGQGAVDTGAADFQDFRDLRDIRVLLPHAVDVSQLDGRDHGGAATAASTSARCLEAGGGALSDQVSLELGESSEDVEDQASAGGGGVDGFTQ